MKKGNRKEIFRDVLNITIAVMLLFNGCSYTSSSTEDMGQSLQQLLLEKTQRSGYYRAAARQAEREGFADVAVYLSEIAEEEASHAKTLSGLQVVLKKTTKKNIDNLLAMEKNALRNTYPAIMEDAKSQGKEEIAAALEKIIQDEERHYSGLNGLEKRVK